MKTCEEYVLNQLKNTQELLLKAEAKIEELEAPKEETVEEPQDMQCIYLSDKPNYYYDVDLAGVYDWNEILKKNKKTPKFVEEALTDENKFKKLCELKNKDSWSSKIGEVKQRIYNYLLKARNGKYVIALSNESAYMIGVDKENCDNFLNEQEAIKCRDEKVRKNIKFYLENYKDKFKGE